MRMPIQHRNRLIVERHRNGSKRKAIAEEFGISPERIRQIVLRATRRDRQVAESHELLKAIREADDPNRPWNRTALFNAIDYPHRVRRLLDKHCYPDAAGISLKQLMDWCLPEVSSASGDLWHCVPAYRITGFGNYNVGDLIHCIDRLDFGAAFGSEWAKRRNAFRAKFRWGVGSGIRGLL